MKIKYSRIILLFFALFVFSECEEKLDLSPIGQLDSESFYQSEKDFNAAILSPYSNLTIYYHNQDGNDWMRPVFMPSDDARDTRGSDQDEEIFNWIPNNGRFSDIWENTYEGIMRANVIIDRLPEAGNFSDESNKVLYEAEAKFLRGFFHFILARHWGNPPVVDQLITSLDDTRVSNSEPGEIWDLIESDLTFAAENLPGEWDSENLGRATAWTAKAFLGKVQIFRAQWMNEPAKYCDAVDNLEEVIANGPYQLMTDFGDNFRLSTENNAEAVFEIQFSRGDFNSWLPNDQELQNNAQVGYSGNARSVYTGASCDNDKCAPGANVNGYGSILPTQGIVDEFEDNDERIRQTVYQPGDFYTEEVPCRTSQSFTEYNPEWSLTGYNIAKYIRPFVPCGFPPNFTTNNERVMRFSEVLLLAAEANVLCDGDVQRAATLINRVRERARNYYEVWNDEPVPAGTLPDRSGSVSEDEMMDFIIHERRVELAFEGHRYDDLVRWHRAGIIDIATDIDFDNTLANNNWSEQHLVKPIPQREIDNNQNLSQNPEYQ